MDAAEKREIEADLRKLHEAGADFEALLHFMRERGFSEADSILPLMRTLKLEMAEARNRIIQSNTWADHRDSNLALQDAAAQAWLELSEQEQGPDFKINIEEDSPNESD